MATFNDATVGADTTANFEAKKSSAPKVRKVQFGDGYEHRLTFGLNQNPKEWSLEWTYRSTADADAIEAFFDARANDNESFDWSPPEDGNTYKFVCEQWTRTLVVAGYSNISATFREVFEP